VVRKLVVKPGQVHRHSFMGNEFMNLNLLTLDFSQVETFNVAGVILSGSSNGVGIAARFHTPSAIFAHDKNLYVADTGNKKIRKIVIATQVGIVASQPNCPLCPTANSKLKRTLRL
jgi:hypothetical protein